MILYLIVFFSAFISWFLGTITATGGSMIFLIILNFFLPVTLIPILIGIVGTFANIYRAFVYLNYVYWPIIKWLVPSTILGSIVGASVFSLFISAEQTDLLRIITGLVLFIGGLIGFLQKNIVLSGKKEWLFSPIGFFVASLSGVIGGAPPLTNILYQRFSLEPNVIIGIKSFNLLALQLTKSITYLVFLFVLRKHEVLFSTNSANHTGSFIIMAMMGIIGVIISVPFAKKILDTINIKLFDHLMDSMLVAFGVYFFFLGLHIF